MKFPKHPKTKQQLVGGYDPRPLIWQPFGLRPKEKDRACD